MKTMLITGAAGFIGQAAWRRFQDRYNLIGIDDLSGKASVQPVCDGTPHRFLPLDVSAAMTGHVLPTVDVVLHLAAQTSVTGSYVSPTRDLLTNALGTLSVAMYAATNGAKVIYASSNKVFGELDGFISPVDDYKTLNPQTPYGISKAAGALYVRDLLPTTGFVFHQSCIYGPTQVGTVDQGWVGWLRQCAANRQPVVCYGDGSQVRDLLHVEDLLDAYELAIDGRLPADSYVIGGGVANAYTFKNVADMLGVTIERYDAWRPRDQRFFVSANLKLQRAGWSPTRRFIDFTSNGGN